MFINDNIVSMPSRAYTSFLQRRIRSNRDGRMGVNALSGLSCYALAGGIALSSTAFQCPLGLITHFYSKGPGRVDTLACVSMPSRAYNSFLQAEARKG